MLLIQIVGWIGAAVLVIAYGLVSSKKIRVDGALYQIMNLFGAIGIGINVFYHHAWPSLAIQIVWGSVAVIVLVKKFLQK